ncbi:3-hydroxyacyl-CoA dehydrogenase [Marinibacterium profundimaris]|uniref:3-hydroxyacyl-CoA dehydrogenase n=1 Tax=Marinibacterium profundimaris TaxID=1679460 RepID=A0A225NPV7_9RHOB|nr:3-hydroxyacyl-CoA dehydrogenase [Marinibacterium profundimaris]OWU73297.1 3-hydroxyacyl-CoA dehydrogenase [Marinibacterium profundimaris]
MENSGDRPIAIIGAGLVGMGWAIVFARAGRKVQVHDASADLLADLPDRLETALADLADHGLIGDPAPIAARITIAGSLAEALRGAVYVQESILERVDVKRALYAEMAPLLAPDAHVGSSSSGIPSSEFTAGLSIAPRCLVAHPVNPPYLLSVVELVPAEWTLPEAVDSVHALMQAVGQHPIRIARELRGFVLNRLQGVLPREAWALYEEGYCSLDDIDATISKGLGPRWAFMGPFETIDLNAPGGIADYAHRLGALYRDIAAERSEHAPWSADLIARADAERRASLPLDKLADRCVWRDQRLMAFAAHKKTQPE